MRGCDRLARDRPPGLTEERSGARNGSRSWTVSFGAWDVVARISKPERKTFPEALATTSVEPTTRCGGNRDCLRTQKTVLNERIPRAGMRLRDGRSRWYGGPVPKSAVRRHSPLRLPSATRSSPDCPERHLRGCAYGLSGDLIHIHHLTGLLEQHLELATMMRSVHVAGKAPYHYAPDEALPADPSVLC